MLLQRSILLEVCLILAVTSVQGSYFSLDGREKKEGPDGAPIFHRADYEKQYIADASHIVSSLDIGTKKENGFESPDYEKIFEQPDEGASNRDSVKYDYSAPPHLKEFFDNTEKKLTEESRDDESVRPGPSYVSHQVPAYEGYDDEDKSESRDSGSVPNEEGRVEKDEDDYKLPKFSFDPLKNTKQKVDYDSGKSSSTVVQYPAESQYPEVAPAASSYVKYDHPNHHFHPASESYQASNTKVYDTLTATAEPYRYEGYDHAGADEHSATDHVYETQPSEDVPTKFSDDNCKKVASNDQNNNCFVCVNPKTNAKYTQCNYKSKKEPVSYYVGNSAKYTVPDKEEDSGRYKRYADKGEETDPYTLIKNRSLKSFESPSLPDDFDADFQYEPEHYDATKPEVTYSEQHAEEIKKNPENCKSVDRKGMTCTVCKDPKTGGNFEQCSYTSTPQEKKYAYVTEKKYDNDEPEETKIVPETKTVELTGESKPTPAESKEKEKTEEYEGHPRQEKAPRKRNEEGHENYENKPAESERKASESAPKESQESQESQEESDDHSHSHYSVPSHFSSVKNGGDYRGSSSEKSSIPSYDFTDFDDYHYKLFPEFAKEESRTAGVKENYDYKEAYGPKEGYGSPKEGYGPKEAYGPKEGYGPKENYDYKNPAPGKENYQVPAEATKQNVETVLAEFSKKDRSNCKKAEKKGMTCYLCVDKNNIQHEECMYVQESRPQSSHVAYHEVKAVKDKPEGLKQQPVVAASNISKRKHFFKKVTTPSPLGLEAAASEQVGVVVSLKPDAAATKDKRSNKEEEVKLAKEESNTNNVEVHEPSPAASDFSDDPDRISEQGEPTIHIPKLGTEEGVDSEETRPVYSKTLGVKLPKYMLEKTELEKEFEAFAASF